MGLLSTLSSRAGGLPSHPSPVSWRTDDGLFYGHDGSCWLYNTLPKQPLFWEDTDARRQHSANLYSMFEELGGLSRSSNLPGVKLGSINREFHLMYLLWDERPEPAPETPLPVQEWLDLIFRQFLVTKAMLTIGVRLRRASRLTPTGFVGLFRSTINEALSQIPDRKEYAADRARVGAILARAGGRPLTNEQALRLEWWYNGGRGSETPVIAEPDGRSISCDGWPEGLEFSALVGYEQDQLNPKNGLWLADAFAHRDGCVVVSCRGELVPASVARDEFRKATRKGRRRIEEQASTGDLERDEDYNLAQTARLMESMFVDTSQPLIRRSSIVFARRATAVSDTYASVLSSQWGLDVKPLEYRQIENGLMETLPCAKTQTRIRGAFSHDMTVGVLAASGIGSHTMIGDSQGVWIGTAPPDDTLVFLDPLGASKENKPPSLGVVGEPGAGKTFFLQLAATQATLAGHAVVFINPKSADSLKDFARAIGGEIVTISSVGTERGLLDPFRYAEPEVAADIAIAHINTVMVSLTEEERIYMAAGIRAAALSGASCVGEALEHERVPKSVAELIRLQAENTPLFGLGVASTSYGKISFAEQGKLTLIEFDRPIPIPRFFGQSSSFDNNERCAVAAVRLICRAALEQMFSAGGGVLIVDEAHVFLSSQEGRAVLQDLGRTGRSQGIMPIMATQLVADLVAEGVDMESYMGRVLVMKMTAEREVPAALQLCGLEDTELRREFLRNAGPVHNPMSPEDNRGALGYYRDLFGRVSAIQIGPVPEEVRMRFSTNLLDRQIKKEAHNAEIAMLSAPMESETVGTV